MHGTPQEIGKSKTGAGRIELAGLYKRFGDGTVAVDGINLVIEDGSYCCLLGPSGCGKTTILRMIAGHETPTDGEIVIGGDNVVGMPPRKRGTAMMFQSYALFPHLSVRDNIAFSLRVRGVRKPERYREADRVIEQVQLDALADRLPAQLSGGQQQRVALARAIIMKPRVLLLDEPLSALDEFLRLQMRSELREMQKRLGITFIHVTHTQLEAVAVADKVVVMEKGRIAQTATAHDIYVAPRNSYVARFMGGQNVLRGKLEGMVPGIGTIRGAAGQRFHLALDGKARVLGQELLFAVRRDRVALARAKGEIRTSDDTVLGAVHEIEFQGIYVKVVIDLAAPGSTVDPFVAYIEESAYFRDPIQLGERVVGSWRMEEARLLADAEIKAKDI
jgi:putative spermidine/putrescine transport system ATP-binding protein